MRKKVVTGMLVTLLILSMLTFVFSVRQVGASGTIYIRADGSVDPPTAPIQRDGDVYFLTDNIYDEIVVERNSIVVDGRGYTVEGGGEGTGIYLRSYADNVTIRNLQIQNSYYGIDVASSSNIIHRNNITYCSVGIFMAEVADTEITENRIAYNDYGIDTNTVFNITVSGNNLINNGVGIQLYWASNSIISGNSITNNWSEGVVLGYSSSNIISGNTITNNGEIGIELDYSSDNYIYHNNFIDNPVYIWASNNVWDDGYPSGGNYWSDYIGSDLFRGANQNETGSDGIGDTPYVIDEYNQDNYPLMRPWTLTPSTRYPWPMFHHNPRHTGYTKSPAPNTNQTQWNYTTGNYVGSSAAVADGKVYVGSDDGKVYCLNALTGTRIWNYTTGNYVDSSPAVADGKVYVGSYDNRVYCLDASTGAHVWNYTTGWSVFSSPAVADGKVYVGSHDNRVYCLNALTGTRIWNYTTGNYVGSSPAVADGKVYVGSYDGKVYCLNALTGTHIWNYTTGNHVDSSPAVADGKVYVGSYDHKVYCLNASTGTHIWNYTTGGGVFSSPAVADGKVYVGSHDNRVYCLNALTGTRIWNYTTGFPVDSSPAVADGKVYVGSDDNKVYCLDASTGAHVWNYTTGNYVISSPAVADGVVYVGSYDGTVYAFGNVIRVPEDFPTVQEAINNATSGATIIIAPGIYYNQSLVINKTLTIIGLPGSAPIFDGGGSGTFVTLLPGASGTTITGIVITNWNQGISFVDSGDCKIYGNIMSLMNNSGIALQGNNAANNRIYNNIFQGNYIAINLTESSTNIIYHNNFIANTDPVYVSPGVYANIWDNGYPSGGNYWSDYAGVDANGDGIGDTPYIIDSNNRDRYPLMKPFRGLAITKTTTSKTVIGQGFTLSINVTILNHGVDDEVSTINIYANTTVKASLPATLTNRNFATITLTWNTTGVAKGNYTVTAHAEPVIGETDTTDNTLTDGWVIVAMVADITGPDGYPDGKVDMRDVYLVARRFGIKPGHPLWNPNCDFNDDEKIDMRDIYLVARNFGKKDP